jgi:hypothetical protein
VQLQVGARVAVIGAGPGGLVAAKHALEAGFDVAIFEASRDLGGQWQAGAAHSGVWPGMHTNTSRAMTAFSDFPSPPDFPLHPAAEQVHEYLRDYADRFGLRRHLRLETRVSRLEPGWTVDGEPFDAVIIASGRFRKPLLPPIADLFAGERLHAFDYPGAAALRGRRVLVYGNGISGLEIASDLAPAAEVVSAFRKPRYVIQKVVDGVSSDWQWYTYFGALQRRTLPRDVFGRMLRERVLKVAGSPADFGAPAPDEDILVAGLSLCQDYLSQIRERSIRCRPEITDIRGRTVTFADGGTEEFDALLCATGYQVDLPYLPDEAQALLGPDLALYRRTLHPDVPTIGFIGQFLAQGPYFPLLELQARWIVDLWSGACAPPPADQMRAALRQPAPALEPHNMLATALADELGVAPDLPARPDLAEPLVFGPLLPPRYRLDGPGAQPAAERLFRTQLAASPRAPVDAADVEALRELGLPQIANLLAGAPAAAVDA